MFKYSAPNRFLWFILTLSILFYCYEFFLRISPSVMLAELMQYFQVNAFGISKCIAIFYIAYSLGQLPAGLLLDRYSVQLILALASFICALGTYLFISTNNLFEAWLGRFIVGFAASFAFIAVLKTARTYLPSKYFTRIVGITIAIGTLTAAYGNVFTSDLNIQNFKHVFYINIFLGLLLGILFSISYCFKINDFIEQKNKNQSCSLSSLIALIKNKPLWINSIIGGLLYLPTVVIADAWGNYFLHCEDHLSLTKTSYTITWLFLGWITGSPLMGYLGDRFKNYRTLMIINTLLSIIILFLILFLSIESLGLLCTLMFLFGFFSSTQLMIWRIFHELAPLEFVATGIALTNMIIMAICALGQIVIGFLLSHHQNSANLNLYNNNDYHHSLILLPLALISTLFLIRLLPRGFRT
jgi:MFS family permease